jgi:hypothetical protein
MKLWAAGEGRKLRDVATEIFRRGLVQRGRPGVKIRNRVKLPLIEWNPSRTKAKEMTSEKLADVLLRQEAAWCNETAGY